MLQITRLLIHAFHKAATRAIRKCQSLLGVSTLGARAIVLNSQKKILLVRHTYQPHWYLPGGGVKRGESIRAAVLRELREEVGVIPNGDPELFGIYFHTYLGVYDYPIIYVVKNFNLIKVHSLEIAQSDWFDYETLPDMISPGTKHRLDEYFSNVSRSDVW
jgi:8-oxo-dGTP pyrophosphatase MutT (NUDIX family)